MKPDILIPSIKDDYELSSIIGGIKYADRDSNVIYSCMKASAAINRNNCLNLATSEIVIMVDDDISGFFPGWDEMLIQPLLDDENTIYVSARLMNEDGSPQKVMGYAKDLRKPVVEVPIHPSACIAFRNDGTRFNDKMLGSQWEDTSFHCRLKEKYGWDKKVVVNNEVKLTHKNEMKMGKYYNHNMKIFDEEFPGKRGVAIIMKTKIHEVEIAFSNACTADCFICSKTHGGNNQAFLQAETFAKIVDSLHDIDFNIIQTGGDGDSFLNEIYIDSLRILKKMFPKKKVILYSNFALLSPEVSDILIGERLITDLYTRVDSLDPAIAKVASGLDSEIVFSNIDYFIKNNRKINFQINYSSILDYFMKCVATLSITPVNWNKAFDNAKVSEYTEVQNRFGSQSGCMVKFSKIKHSFWAERTNPDIKPEPDLKCERTYCFDSTCYIWPSGKVGICGYDDGQDTMIIGDIHEESLSDIWNGQARQEMISHVKNRGIKGYPCINPKACLFY